jgi:hypothetical protein
MRLEIQNEWTYALTSGEYQQGQSALAIHDNDGPTYCCLGVLCELAANAGILTRDRAMHPDLGCDVTIYQDADGARHQSYLPWSVVEWAGLEDYAAGSQENAGTLDGTEMGTVSGTDIRINPAITGWTSNTLGGENDNGATFAEIANLIRNFAVTP